VLCFGSADSEGVTGQFFGSADYKGVRRGRLKEARKDFGAKGYTPSVFQKSAEVIDCRRVGETLFLEECARI
jgi:hypothetical protein